MSKRAANGSPSKRPPAKRARGVIGAASQADDSARLIASHHAQEHLLGGSTYLSKRSASRNGGGVRSLVDISLHASAAALLEVVQVRQVARDEVVKKFGWDPAKRKAQGNDEDAGELAALREFVEHLPEATANRLFELTLSYSTRDGKSSELDSFRLAKLFLHSNTTTLSLSSLGPTSHLVSKLPDCTALVDLDLSSNTTLSDTMLKGVLPKLVKLERVVFRGCTKLGDATVIALSKATEHRLKDVNLSLTAVTIKGLTSLLSRCSALEVLKLANVQGLNEKAVTKLVDDATAGASSFRHFPLSSLRILKLRSTDLSDSSLGRLLALCALTLTHLDISYTSVKSLDIVTRALGASPEWRLAKLVASGLPLSPATLVGFFEPLANRSKVERDRFRTIKLGAIPSSSNKAPGLTDAVLAKFLPFLEELEGIEKVSFHMNQELGRNREPMTRFMEIVGRRCTVMDLTLPMLQSHHLDGFLPPLDADADDAPLPAPRIVTLVLDKSFLSDDAASAIAECKDLRELHVAETRISTKFLAVVMAECPKLQTLNLTSCRGVPVVQRRTFFEAFARGEVE